MTIIPAISVIIPSFRDTQDVHRLLAGFRASDASEDIEVVVVDDGCHDPDLDAALTSSGFGGRVIHRATNGGFAAAVNTGFEASNGDAVCIVNSDVVVQSDVLEELCRRVRESPFAIHAPATVDEAGQWLPTARRFPTPWSMAAEFAIPFRLWPALDRLVRDFDRAADRAAAPARTEWLTGACLAVSRQVIDALGLMDEEYGMYMEEVDWQLRADRMGIARFVHPDLSIVHVLGGSHGVRDGDRRFEQLWTSRIRYLGRHLPKGVLLLRFLSLPAMVANTLLWGMGWALPGRRQQIRTQSRRHWAALRIIWRRPPP